MEEQLRKWRDEQLNISSQVIIRPDEDSFISGYKFLPISGNVGKGANDGKVLGGVDVSFGKGNSAVAVYVVLNRDDTIVYQDSIEFTLTVPYVSSYLAFREIEPLTDLVMKQKNCKPEFTPDVILVDGNGIFHERGAGIASCLGVRTNTRTIGVGKTLYCMDGLGHDVVGYGLEQKVEQFLKDCEEETIDNLVGHKNVDSDSEVDRRVLIMTESPIQPPERDQINVETSRPFQENIQSISKYCDGICVPLMGKSGSVLAAALVGHGGILSRRASSGKGKKGGTKIPIFISIGNDISLQEALQVCGRALSRIPEPVRQADLIGRQIMREKGI
mmetsp:Transcript_13129/g.19878  ORF Transcript_13129/g.19878 Transcript_13129/m.19878 type:complete len:331 (-) Transcript_13129:1344-2336(-)|eukprot:CAMPEP_0203684670 /NCGR_PEP_ID=MMETSP0090-20130426/48155_1 /ASSEMBLY_ACC=CAM_ASM_001088 /TAXON_ID=426623 /ORGANISM="Chaetoceros affinis, Strain CCMP159" /LENGTH=330 /DNA_ID=CAMNT_0050553849 /DNA_START=795 /DNA_END=1787 /DNA_ORIENTATION=+